MVERIHEMRKVGRGDWLLPANDGVTLYRLVKYEERDGTLSRTDGSVICSDFWLVRKFSYPMQSLAPEDLVFPDQWTEVASMLPTRAAAIDLVLALPLGTL